MTDNLIALAQTTDQLNDMGSDTESEQFFIALEVEKKMQQILPSSKETPQLFHRLTDYPTENIPF